MDEGRLDPRNKLNDLTGKQWLKLTKSFWISEKIGDDKFAFKHPAPFLIRDIEKLISMFTKKDMVVLDPFAGVATTMVAAHNTGRKSIGIDLSQEYCELATQRLDSLDIDTTRQKIVQGDSLVEVPRIKSEVDYCVTSPPYHNILQNNGGGLRADKNGFRTGSRIGTVYYSDEPNDLGNQASYDEFILLLQKIMTEVYKKLRHKAYATIIISDFTVDKKERNVQGDIVRTLEAIGYEFVGTTVLLQNHKPLYPFGYPFAYKINHHHQNIINFRKNGES